MKSKIIIVCSDNRDIRCRALRKVKDDRIESSACFKAVFDLNNL